MQGTFEKKLTDKFGIFDVQNVEYLLFYQFVWPGGDIYPTRHIISQDDPHERSWLSLETEQDSATDFEKKILKNNKIRKMLGKIRKLEFDSIFKSDLF